MSLLTITRTGRAADIVSSIRGIVHDQVPLITAKALTFTVQKAQASIIDKMRESFAGGATRYTLNSTRIETATPDNLTARVAVKDIAGSGNLPQDYLFPEVFGGGRTEKRFERALRYAGIMQSGERATAGYDAELDAYGNIKRTEIQKILAMVRKPVEPYKVKSRSKGKSKTPAKGGYYLVNSGPGRGVWKRKNGEALSVLIFVRKSPTYGKRLDFEGIARTVAEQEFEPTFRRLLQTAADKR